ncbi:hypothetical protein F0562_003970 [Nyssa sinensis]|uniref:HTH La-type RNA-binding domain-containing protein n=1 Tax=Nyssa sinensis TaxID=561372 RepID=A0A5J5C226_9ASTE|nr:hypothetical protein F0562_003970 [Nyssa sinensis]
MASTTANNHSPRSSVESPQSRRAARAPWTQIVRGGGESEPIISSSVMASEAPSSPSSSAAFNEQATSSSDWSPSKLAAAPEEEVQPESSDSNAAKKPAWNKPSNGALEVGPVMGADSWPALSESTRASPKSSSESLKTLSDGSASQVSGVGIASSSSQKQIITNNANTSLTQNHATPARQKVTRRVSGSSSGSVSDNGGSLQPPLPSPGSAVEMPSNNAGKSGSVLLESSPREHTHKESGQRGGFGSQSHSGNDHTQQRSSFRRGNGGPHPRGDGSYHHNYGNRRDQDRGNHDWNPHHRSFNGRDAHMQPQRVVPRSYNRPPPPSSPQFMPPPPMPVRSFGVYPDVASSLIYLTPSPDPLRGLPIVTPMPHHAMYYPVPDPQLHTKIVSQIDYYFSNENLIKDTFLRQNMDDQGWVPIKLIAGFKKVMVLYHRQDKGSGNSDLYPLGPLHLVKRGDFKVGLNVLSAPIL